MPETVPAKVGASRAIWCAPPWPSGNWCIAASIFQPWPRKQCSDPVVCSSDSRIASNTAIMQGLHYVLLGQCIAANPYTASVSNYSISEHIAFVILTSEAQLDQ